MQPPREPGWTPHPLLEATVLAADLPRPLAELPSPPWLVALLDLAAPAPLQRSEEVRVAVRRLLRCTGYKPTGRNKPASEYLVQAAGRGELASINAAVDVCNAVSLASGLPASVVDRARLIGPLHVTTAGPGASFVFNASGQVIDLEGLPCLCDAEGPVANAVKDAQRTKTSPATTLLLAVVWGTTDLPGRSEATAAHFAELLRRLGAEVAILGSDLPRGRQ
jgi:DNA/RNA-binding domain of Phe-tRNA-synthetase-like protein